jgi:hypothetical protein
LKNGKISETVIRGSDSCFAAVAKQEKGKRTAAAVRLPFYR